MENTKKETKGEAIHKSPVQEKTEAPKETIKEETLSEDPVEEVKEETPEEEVKEEKPAKKDDKEDGKADLNDLDKKLDEILNDDIIN